MDGFKYDAKDITIGADLIAQDGRTLSYVRKRRGKSALANTDGTISDEATVAAFQEEFGDGIMSAIDFDMDITRKSDPKGDRVSLGMTGKFLPYKYYGATGNALAYGLKEE